ncbi:hypothetical protein ACPBEH_11565 (plasmid) [Latilactobacillus sp. 5-91]|uniref:hypothetical protein n=1 Tax=Latilactobacillus sp. 5-91 TaxID=3410924 RepID=UPI003C76DDAB
MKIDDIIAKKKRDPEWDSGYDATRDRFEPVLSLGFNDLALERMIDLFEDSGETGKEKLL